MNKVILMGRLTKDPDMRGEGTSLCARYTLAVDRKYSKNNEEKQTDFINCVVFSKGAEFAEKYFKKGTKVLITGRIQTGSYTNKDGAKVYTTDIVCEEQEFAESKGAGNGENSQENAPNSNDNDFMSISDAEKDDMPF